jgi:peptide subunit release factor 1 (eRF1)
MRVLRLGPRTRRDGETYDSLQPRPEERPHVPVITEDDLRALAAVRSNGALVTTCYLDVDGGRYVRPADYERALDEMVRRLRRRDEVDEAVEADIARIVERVGEGFDRTTTRGVAIFCCGVHDLFVVHELPVPVRNEMVVNPTPAVGQLELVLQQSEKVALLAVDKQHARVYVYRLGELVEHVERTDDIGRDYDTVGEHDRGGVQQHRDEMTHRHLRHAAELAWSVYQSTGFDHLVVAAAEAVASEMEQDLHPYLAERLRARLDVPPGAPEPEMRRAALEAERMIEAAREAALVEELRAAVHGGGRGVAGIGPVVDALAERRVDRLVVSDGYAVEGWRCDDCDRLATVGRQCRCGADMVAVPDLVEEAVEVALGQSCQVVVCDGNADLDVLGRVGALLRY